MKSRNILLGFLLTISIFLASLSLSSCSTERKTTQQKIAEIVQEQFNYIDQLGFEGSSLSLDEAQAILYCWAENEEDISEKELKEAIYAVLESTDLIRDLIYDIDEIDLDMYS